MFLSLISLSWILSITLIFLNHPMSFGLILLSQTLITSMVTGMIGPDFWFSYILFLIMVGSMLVLFIYMTSIASNEKFKFSKKMNLLILLLLMMPIFLFVDNFISFMNTNAYDSSNQSLTNINLSMNKLFNFPNMLIMILMMIYLLITLIAIVKITYSSQGPLRSTK